MLLEDVEIGCRFCGFTSHRELIIGQEIDRRERVIDFSKLGVTPEMLGQSIVNGGTIDGVHADGNQAADKRGVALDGGEQLVVELDVLQGEIGLVVIQRENGVERQNLGQLNLIGHEAKRAGGGRRGRIVLIEAAKGARGGGAAQVGEKGKDGVELNKGVVGWLGALESKREIGGHHTSSLRHVG